MSLPAHAQRLLDALGSSPAYALTPYWSIVGWNRAYEALYPPVATATTQDRNLLWLVFTDPYVRGLLADWRTDSRRFLTQFRAEAGSRVHEPAFADLIGRLQEASEHFRAGWASHDVDQFASTERRFEHPDAGTLMLEHHRLALSDHPDLHLVIYPAAAGAQAPDTHQLSREATPPRTQARRTAPVRRCASATAASRAWVASATVKVRSGARNWRLTARERCPAPTCAPV